MKPDEKPVCVQVTDPDTGDVETVERERDARADDQGAPIVTVLLSSEAREPTGEDATVLADALDRFFSDLRYTAPELVSMRLNQLGGRIEATMAALGYPKKPR